MTNRSPCAYRKVGRFCVRVALAVCLLVFGLGEALERGVAGHVGLEAALSFAVTADPSVVASADHSGAHVDEATHGDLGAGGMSVGHGCHGCATLPQPTPRLAASPLGARTALAWAATPSAAGREPLVDLPPPRA